MRLESNSPTRPVKCRTELMIPYSRFEPKTHVPAGNQPKSLTHYSKFDLNQLPSISIASAELFWDSFKQREVISFTLESNKDRIRDDVSQRETLIFFEMACFHSASSTSNSESKFLRKIHLLLLLNRDIIPHLSVPKQAVETSSLPTLNPLQMNINLNQTKPIKIDNSQNKRATQSSSNKSAINENFISFQNKEIESRIDLMGDTIKVNSRNSTESFANNGQPARFAPGLVNLKELDSIRMRLKTNSFLILTVVSSFVILTYTLCLLIYLKTRKSREKHSEIRGNRIMKTKSQKPKQLALDISQPFNLQMEPETRIRLENLLNVRSKCSSIDSGECYFEQDQQSQNVYSELNDRHELVKPHRRSTTSKYCHYFERENDHKPCQCDYNSYLDQSFVPSQNQANFAYYGTLNVMRAIRQAATLARYRIRNTRYQPNLKVIPESDYEQTQTQTLNRSNLEHCEQLLNDSTNELSIKADQIETLLYNAMKSKCCHFTEKAHKRKKRHKNNQANTTLFSRPNKCSDSAVGAELEGDAVSRSRIIRYVQSDESGGSNNKSAENIDTRI